MTFKLVLEYLNFAADVVSLLSNRHCDTYTQTDRVKARWALKINTLETKLMKKNNTLN